MSMTRHLVNRQRRLAARTDAPSQPPTGEEPPRRPDPEQKRKPKPEKEPRRKKEKRERTGRSALLVPAILGLIAVLLGGFALWANAEADSLKDDPATRNTALSDPVATSEVIGTVSQAVNELFSYDFASPERTASAAEEWLTGDAVEQHATLLAPVLEAGEEQRMVLTTTVTHAGVEVIEGDRARLLLYADQSSAQAAEEDEEEAETLYAPAALAVEAVHRDGHWLIAGIETYGG
ncbi:hypothetical protein [Streptomyces sp. NBC_01803]|uniref:hypothetical protein n=1 Tax=Streptomyces sp. NBC_01803 TaxID=2975946 RepID=UPI002DDB6C19|nr:hypothetical protein [Streptomyces sp. NBC_01803]WSA43556.1 hypothetical protein OIE51_04680 [Streptomyces sp. NBC_01803]